MVVCVAVGATTDGLVLDALSGHLGAVAPSPISSSAEPDES
jgi:hypothetical protein